MKGKSKILGLLFLVVAVFFIGNRIAVLYTASAGNLLERLEFVFSKRFFTLSWADNFKLTNRSTLLFGLLAVFFLFAFWFYNYGRRKNNRAGEEHGSAEWGSAADSRPFEQKEKNKNIILSQNIGLSLTNVGLDYAFQTNKNVLVVGGSGSGKTRFFLKPNLLQKHSCYIVTDPKGTCLAEVGNALKNDYSLFWFNTVDLEKSMCYNPLEYARNYQDILILADVLIMNTTSPDARSSDPFWVDAEKLLYVAIISLIRYDWDYENEKNFNTFLDLFEFVDADEAHPDKATILDMVFEMAELNRPDSFAVKIYRDFKKAPGRTAAGIVISAAARLMPFRIPTIRELFETDELELNRIGFDKTAHFLVVDDTDTTFDFIVGFLYAQMLSRMIRNADMNEGKLPIHTRLLMDEAGNIAKIRNLDKVTGQIRSREISCCLLYQNPEQLKSLYRDKASVIVGNCDTMVFLGSEEYGVGKMISEKIGDETVAYTTQSETRGRQGSFSKAENLTRRRLMAPEEVRKLPADQCIVFIKGLPPIIDKKYRYENHPNYKLTGDANKAQRFKIAERQPAKDRAGEANGGPGPDAASADRERVREPEYIVTGREYQERENRLTLTIECV